MTRTTTIRATKATTGALRNIAARLGYVARTGPFAGGGDVAKMLEAVARGDLTLTPASPAQPDEPPDHKTGQK